MERQPPNGLPVYRLLTGPDDETFCRRVSHALSLGYRLHGSPGICAHGAQIQVAQAMIWPHFSSDQEIKPR